MGGALQCGVRGRAGCGVPEGRQRDLAVNGLRVFTAKRFESVTQSSGEIYSCDAEIKKLINKYIKR